MTRRRRCVLGALMLLLFGCGKGKKCEASGCSSPHRVTQTRGDERVTGELTLDDTRRYATTASLRFVPIRDGSLDVVECSEPEGGGAVSCDGTTSAYRAVRLTIHLDLPDDEDEHDLEDVGGEAWFCEAPTARLAPVARADGSIEPACFDKGVQHVPARHEALRGKLVTRARPVDLDELYDDEDGWAYSYELAIEGGRLAAHLDVVAWSTTTISDCDMY